MRSDEIEVIADKHMLDGIICNLVSNAIKFTPVGGKVTVTADYASDQSIKISINDIGTWNCIQTNHLITNYLF